MSLFSFRHQERDSELEKALLGIPFSGSLKFGYAGRGKEKSSPTNSSAYIIPLDAHDKVIYGNFFLDGKLAEVPLGFLRKSIFLFKEPFRFSLEGNLVREERTHDSVLYLPLKRTDLFVGIATGKEDAEKEGKLAAVEGSPFLVYGLEGQEWTYPLILVAENENGIVCKGLYRAKDGMVAAYDHHRTKPSDLQLRNFLRALRGVKVIVPERKAAPENSSISPAPRRNNSGRESRRDNGADELAKYRGIYAGKVSASERIHWEEPKSIVAYLDRYVIGQEEAKKAVAVAFSNYVTKAKSQNEELQKENILLIGPSGVGKTYMINLLAKRAELPVVQTKLTGKTAAGYKNENLSCVFEQMRSLAPGEEAPYGIIFFDEIDKLARDRWADGESGFGTRLQGELIGWLEEATVLGDQKNEKGKYGINTKNLLFIAAGAFQGSDEDSSLAAIISKRLSKKRRQIGFGMVENGKIETREIEIGGDNEAAGRSETRNETNEKNEKAQGNILYKVRPEDLIAYGLKPELVGRLPSLGVLHPLTIEDKVKILTSTQKSSLTSYTNLLAQKGFQVELAPEVLEIIARRCPEETGARALNAVCSDLFKDIMFDPLQYADDQKVIRITSELAGKLISLYN